MIPGVNGDRCPSDAECREELERILATAAFTGAPKLANFLRYIVSAALTGKGERLKGYTIGVEALGRAPSFDPQTDPIVRVEAGRLRRALARYYAGDGRNAPVVIDLPRGTYVPTFRRRNPPLGLGKYSSSARRFVFRNALGRWRLVTRLAVIVTSISVIINVALVTLMWRSATLASHAAIAKPEPTPVAAVPLGFPFIVVQPFDAEGLSGDAAAAVKRLRVKLRDALARFDDIDVASVDIEPSGAAVGPGAAPRDSYRLAATAEQRADGRLTLFFRLHDVAERTIVWATSFENLQVSEATIAGEHDIVRRLAPTLAQPYGVIYSREMAKGPEGNGDPRYRCIVAAFEFYRWNAAAYRAELQDCVDRVFPKWPASAASQSVVAIQLMRDYYASGDIAVLDRATDAAHRAVSLDPASGRAHQVMMNALYTRGDAVAALEEGRKAVAANPYDMLVLTAYAVRLLWSGEVEKASVLLRQAEEFSPGQPQFLNFALFMASYMRGDDIAASRYAIKLTGIDSSYGAAARALVAQRSGQRARARDEIQKLSQIHPFWRNNARALFERFGMPPGVAARLATDLDTAGRDAAN